MIYNEAVLSVASCRRLSSRGLLIFEGFGFILAHVMRFLQLLPSIFACCASPIFVHLRVLLFLSKLLLIAVNQRSSLSTRVGSALTFQMSATTLCTHLSILYTYLQLYHFYSQLPANVLVRFPNVCCVVPKERSSSLMPQNLDFNLYFQLRF